MEAHDDPQLRELVNSADLVTPDGMPLVWALRRLGYPQQGRVYGPDLTLELVAAAAGKGIPVGFYGSTPETLASLADNFKRRFPALHIAYSFSPPFRELSPGEDEIIIKTVNASGIRVLFVGLGCPKQERWVAVHKGKIQAVMLAVGAAFDFHAGTRRQAPRWMMRLGLEWVFRLVQEPGRLWRRYLYHNPRFILLMAWQLLFKGK